MVAITNEPLLMFTGLVASLAAVGIDEGNPVWLGLDYPDLGGFSVKSGNLALVIRQ